MLIPDKVKLLGSYYEKHRIQVNLNILKIVLIYLLLSIVWNGIFLLFQLPFSRAQIIPFLICTLGWFVLVGFKHLFHASSRVMQHLILIFVVIVIVCLYFSSGYREAWAYCLIIPMVSAFYGDRPILIIYSMLGMMLMLALGMWYPLIEEVFDSIDLSNRILLYLIIATFSHLILLQLKRLYESQVNTILQSAESSIEQIVTSFVISVEAKDQYTFGHSERVSKYAIELAKLLPEYQEQNELRRLRLTGLMHDIGKMNIPEHILVKEGKLTVKEFDLIRTHPVIGAKMVEKISLLGSLKPGVLYHHEKWDGSGYPAGLSKKDIPLDARILAIADVFDAVTSNRTYRTAMNVEEAFQLLEHESGTHFDPELIRLLGTVKQRWIEIYDEANSGVREFEKLTDLL